MNEDAVYDNKMQRLGRFTPKFKLQIDIRLAQVEEIRNNCQTEKTLFFIMNLEGKEYDER